MSWFHLALLAHIAGVLALFGTLMVEMAAIALLRRADTVMQVGDSSILMGRLGQVFGVSGALIFLSGLYMSILRMQHSESIGWVIVSLVLFIIVAIAGSASGRKTERALREGLERSDGRFTPELQTLAKRNPAQANVIFGPIAVLGITALMIYQPSVLISILVVLVTVLVGWLVFKQQAAEHFHPMRRHRASAKY